MREHNRESLCQQHSVTNPVARLKVQSIQNSKKSQQHSSLLQTGQ
jgi:hypothetical protein